MWLDGKTADAWTVRSVGSLLNALSAVGIFLVVSSLLRQGHLSAASRETVALAGATVYLFMPEVIHAPATVWAHHIAMPIYLSFLLVAISSRDTVLSSAILGMLAAISGMFEWSGYVLCFGVATGLFLSGRRRQAIATIGGLLVASLVTLGVFVWSFGVESWLAALTGRVEENGGGGRGMSYGQLFAVYMRSYWPLVIGVVILTGALRVVGDDAFAGILSGIRERNHRVLVVAGFAVAAVLENMILKDHAVVYTFATLKVGAILAVLLALLSGKILSRLGRLGSLYVAVGAAGLAVLGAGEWRLTSSSPPGVQTSAEILKIRARVDDLAGAHDFIILDPAFRQINWVTFSLKDAETAALLGRRSVISASPCSALAEARMAGLDVKNAVFIRGLLAARGDVSRQSSPVDYETWMRNHGNLTGAILVGVSSGSGRPASGCQTSDRSPSGSWKKVRRGLE